MGLAYLTTYLALVLVACYVIWRWTRRNYEKMGDMIPGPPSIPLLGNILNIGFSPVDLYYSILHLSKTYNSLCRIWIGPVLYVGVFKPDDIEIIMTNTKYNTKAYMYKFLRPWLGTGLLTASGEKWHKHRKIITPTFHFKILEEFLHSFNNKADVLIERLQAEVNGPSFDILKYVTLYTLDTITETAMGLNINAQTDENSKYVSAVKTIADTIIKRALRIWYYPDAIFKYSSLARRQEKTLAILHGTTEKMILERKEELAKKTNQHSSNDTEAELGIKKRVAFLDLLLQRSAEEDSMSDEDVREEVDTFMFEGHDTTSSALSFTLLLLSKHPEIQEKVYKEIDAVLGGVETPTTKLISELKYLECVIKEGLRMYPSVPLLGREIYEDTKLTGNVTLPANTTILIPIYLVHQNSTLFPDPETFNPDRFLPDSAREIHPFAFIPFSAGSRNCIGQKFAMLEMKIAIAKILMKYKFLPDETFEPILSAELIIKSVNGIKMKIVQRHPQNTPM